ncbi:hypothetical protein [Nitrosomonas sp. Nm166]|nr:hypothetical protein [Nitrosomonas sp. Nm166]
MLIRPDQLADQCTITDMGDGKMRWWSGYPRIMLAYYVRMPPASN